MDSILIAGYVVFIMAGLGLAALSLDDRIGLYERTVHIPFLGNTAKASPTSIQRDAANMVQMMVGVIIVTACVSLALVVLWRRTRLGRAALVVALLIVSLVEVAVYRRRGTWLLDGPVAIAHSGGSKDVDVYHTRTGHSLSIYGNPNVA